MHETKNTIIIIYNPMLMALCFKLYCGFQRAILLSISVLSIIIPVYLFSLSFSPIALAYQKPHTHTHTHTHTHSHANCEQAVVICCSHCTQQQGRSRQSVRDNQCSSQQSFIPGAGTDFYGQ